MSHALALFKKILLFPFRFFRRLSLKKKIVVIILLVIGVFVGMGILSSANAKPPYTTVKAEGADIVEVVTETGNISSSGKTDIYSPANGIVESVLVANGDLVTLSQELFTVRSTATEQEKAQALAAYLTAKNTLDTAQATLYSLQATMFDKWDAFKELAESDDYEEANGTPKYAQRGLPEFHIPEKEWLAAEANYKKQQSVISQAQAAVSSAYLQYQATQNATIKATTAGTISNLSVTTGHTVKAYSLAAPTIPLATIANFAITEVVVSLSESDIAKIAPAQDVTIEVNSITDKRYKGIVRRADAIGTEIAGVVRYNVYIEILDSDDRLRPGMTVDTDIITKNVTNVLSVPNAAVKPYQGGRAVRVPDAKTKAVTYVPVEIGVKGAERTQILSGIDEGQEVITSLSNEQLRRPGLFGN